MQFEDEEEFGVDITGQHHELFLLRLTSLFTTKKYL
jgi:hypothetical protein